MSATVKEQRVLVASGLHLRPETDEGAGQRFIDLPDPKTGNRSTYLLTAGGLQEIHWFKQRFSSWFVDDSVRQDGGMYVGTPVDALLVLLPVLERARGEGKFCDVEHILECAGVPGAALLAPLLLGQLECMCEWKEAGGQRYYRMSDSRSLAWLRLKVDQAARALRAAPDGAFATMDESSLAGYAAGLVGEYLPPRWHARLLASLGVQDASQPPAAAAVPAGVPVNYDANEAFAPSEPKRQRLDPKEAAKAKAREATKAARAEKATKEASTMRKMSSFFAKA